MVAFTNDTGAALKRSPEDQAFRLRFLAVVHDAIASRQKEDGGSGQVHSERARKLRIHADLIEQRVITTRPR